MNRNRNPYRVEFEQARNRISELQAEISSIRSKDKAKIKNLENQITILSQITDKQEEEITSLRELNQKLLKSKESQPNQEQRDSLSKEERIQLLRIEAKGLHKEHSVKHTDLSHAKTDNERFEIAKDIMERIIPSLDKIYDNIRRLERGEVKEEEQASISTDFQKGVETMRKISSLKVTISKNKRKLKKPLSEEDKVKVKRVITVKEEELSQLLKLIE